MKRTLKKTALTQTTEEYASRSSIHGISYTFDRELNIFDRLLWLLVVLAFLGIAAALTWDFWSQWRNEQVIKLLYILYVSYIILDSHATVLIEGSDCQVVTVLKNTAKLVSDVPFPALTICGSGLHMSNVEKKLIKDFDDWRVEKNRNGTTKEAIYKDVEEFWSL